MKDTSYYYDMRELALDVRARHEIDGANVSIRDMWKIYRSEGIEQLRFWPGFVNLRGAYFGNHFKVTVVVAAGMADEPTIFTMAHELKHHLVDSNIGAMLCLPEDQRRRVEIGAEVFAAELIYPEKDFVYDLFRLLRGMPQEVKPEILVELKRRTKTTLSYAALAKRTVLLRLAEETEFKDVRWGMIKRRQGMD